METIKKALLILAIPAIMSGTAWGEKAPDGLTFDPSSGKHDTLEMPDGSVVGYTSYTDLRYVARVEDSVYQRMHVFVPDGADSKTPIFMTNYVSGYMAAEPMMINPADASGRALKEGYVVAIPGARGRSSTIERNGERIYTGRAPKGLLDLKAAVRYLRAFDKQMAGDAERIITNGTSAGGAMSSLLGSTSNNPAYNDMLRSMGAADRRDDVFASVCFCPITDLDHADMAYEWMYGKVRTMDEGQKEISQRLAERFETYVNSLNLVEPDGKPLNADNYMDYIGKLIMESAQIAKDAGADIPDTIGFVFSNSVGFAPPMGGKMPKRGMPPAMDGVRRGMPQQMSGMPLGGPPKEKGEYITDLDMSTYLRYVAGTTALKPVPAFDSQGVYGGRASGENEEFGDEKGRSVNFTDFSLQYSTGDATVQVPDSVKENVRLMNPMRMMDEQGSTVAKYWYIRHGARDRDTSFTIPVNLALKLQNKGCSVDLKLPWNRPHAGDYALNELFDWIAGIL